MHYFKLGDFTFKAGNLQVNRLKRSLNYGFAKQQPLSGNAQYQATGGVEESFSLDCVFLPGQGQAFKDLETLAAQKKALIMVLGTGEIIGEILIMNLEYSGHSFFPNGRALQQNLSLSLVKVAP